MNTGSDYYFDRTLTGFRNRPFILISCAVSTTLHEHCLNLCRRSGFTPNIVQEASETFKILSLVRAGLGVSLVPSSTERMRVPGLRFNHLRMNDANWSIGVAWPRGSERQKPISRFVEIIRSVIRTGP